ncbi:hypothetical protein VNO77_37672 [Canavalia gladiata]|uniref:Uncharacterized protein n=1 Tax=Canavalia gladiata TaxID=3824 RepID=A0AAN9KAA3_CANGL
MFTASGVINVWLGGAQGRIKPQSRQNALKLYGVCTWHPRLELMEYLCFPSLNSRSNGSPLGLKARENFWSMDHVFYELIKEVSQVKVGMDDEAVMKVDFPV